MAELRALLHFVMFVVAVVIREQRLVPPKQRPKLTNPWNSVEESIHEGVDATT